MGRNGNGHPSTKPTKTKKKQLRGWLGMGQVQKCSPWAALGDVARSLPSPNRRRTIQHHSRAAPSFGIQPAAQQLQGRELYNRLSPGRCSNMRHLACFKPPGRFCGGLQKANYKKGDAPVLSYIRLLNALSARHFSSCPPSLTLPPACWKHAGQAVRHVADPLSLP